MVPRYVTRILGHLFPIVRSIPPTILDGSQSLMYSLIWGDLSPVCSLSCFKLAKLRSLPYLMNLFLSAHDLQFLHLALIIIFFILFFSFVNNFKMFSIWILCICFTQYNITLKKSGIFHDIVEHHK